MPIDLSLYPNDARQPKPVNVTARGNYEWSRFRAVYLDGITEQASGAVFFPLSQVNTLLFCSDYPAVVRAEEVFPGDVFVGTVKVGENLTNEGSWVNDGDCGGSAEIVISTPVEQGQVARASLATAGIDVYGYPGYTFLSYHAFLDSSEGEAKGCGLYVDVSAQSPLMHGVDSYTEPAAEELDFVASVIIPATDYSAAIRDAGNIIEPAAGVRWYVVGIYDAVLGPYSGGK